MSQNDLEKYRRKEQPKHLSNDLEQYRRKEQPKNVSVEDQYHPMIRKIAEFVAKHPDLNKRVEQAANFAEPFGAFAGGVVQQAGDMGASLGNFLGMPVNKLLGTDYKIPHPKIRERFEPGLLNDLAFLGGEIGGGLVGGGGVGTGKGIVQALQKLPRAGGKKGLMQDILKGVGTGYVLGEQNDEGEGRGLGALIGGIAQPLSSITNKGITNRILKDREKLLSEHGNVYKDIFGAAEKRGVDLVPRNLMEINGKNSEKTIKRLLDRLPKDHKKIVEEFLTDPSLENAHKLQSDLGKFTRAIEGDKRLKTKSLPLNLQRAYEAAGDVRKALQSDISESLTRKGLIKESLQYPGVTESYAKNVAPYFNKPIGDVLAGTKHPEKLAQRLRNDEQFMIEMGEKYPELGLNKYLTKAVGGGLIGTGLIATLLGIPKFAHAQDKKLPKNKEPFLVTGEGHEVYD